MGKKSSAAFAQEMCFLIALQRCKEATKNGIYRGLRGSRGYRKGPVISGKVFAKTNNFEQLHCKGAKTQQKTEFTADYADHADTEKEIRVICNFDSEGEVGQIA